MMNSQTLDVTKCELITVESCSRLDSYNPSDTEAPDVILLDFNGIYLVNSAAIASLIRFALRFRGVNQSVRAVNLSPELKELFRLTRVDRMLPLETSRSDELASPN